MVLYSFTILLGNIGWLFLSFTALRPKPLARSAAAEKIIRNLRRQAIGAFWLYRRDLQGSAGVKDPARWTRHDALFVVARAEIP